MRKKRFKITRRSQTAAKPVHQKHDKGYKHILSHKQQFLHFLKTYIEADWVNDIDENDLDLIDKTFIDADFRQKESDVIYKLKFKGREIIFYVLLELQSSVDFTMPFRLLRYITALLKREFRSTAKNVREAKGYRLPAVVPIVLYNGADNWTAVRRFKEDVNGYEQFGEYIIDFKYLLFDLKREPEEAVLSGNQVIDMAFALDRVKKNNVGETLNTVSKKYRQMTDEEKEDLENWIEYIWLDEVKDKEEKSKILSNFKRGEITNMVSGFGAILQEERLEGKKEAEKKKNMKLIEKMLKRGDSIDEIADFLDITVDEVEGLIKER